MKASKTKSADRFAELRAANTSGELQAALAALNDDLQRLVQEHSEAERARDQAILEGTDPLALRTRVTDLATEIADLRMAIDAASGRQAEAEKRERDSGIQNKHAEAQQVAAELGEKQRTFDAQLMEVRATHADVDRLRAQLNRINDSLESLGHSELRVKAANVRRDSFDQETRRKSFPGLTRNGQRLDALLKDIGTPGMAIRVNPRHRGIGPKSLPAA